MVSAKAMANHSVAKRVVLSVLIGVLAAVVFVAWTAWNSGQLGWAHVVGMGASVLILVAVWLWPAGDQPTQPPP